MRRLCRECGQVSRRRGTCPWCGSAAVYEAEECEGCGGMREAEEVLCQSCARALREDFRRYLTGLVSAQRRYLDEALDGRGLEEFW